MTRAILTIDDSPSPHTRELVEFCTARDITPVLFCRGDRMDQFGDDGLRAALDQGVILAHHSYHHQPAGLWGFDAWRDDFLAMQDRLGDVYEAAGMAWENKLYRFPYVDRGDGDRIERRFADLAKGGTIETNDHVKRIQDFLADQGYAQNLGDVSHPLYDNPVVAQAHDCLFTYSSCDWMMTSRHKGKQIYQTPDDLVAALDADPWLQQDDWDHIILMHDEAEIHDVTLHLIAAMVARNFKFMERF